MNDTTIDLNCDLGESYGVYTLGMDEAVMPHITSANIACGWHAGDPVVMNTTVKLAAEHGIKCGAHPGYPDLLGFGRREMNVNNEDLKWYLLYQIGALQAFCRAHNTTLHHVKPHGSLYLKAAQNEEMTTAIVQAISQLDRNLVYVTLAGEKGKKMARIAEDHGLRVAMEAFPDRAYTDDGALAPRSMSGAVITEPEEVLRRAVKMAKEKCIETINGNVIELEAHTLCVHGDNPHAVEMVREIRGALKENDITLRPVS
jgi:UPF0271 protein